jgi:hypothetical protein
LARCVSKRGGCTAPEHAVTRPRPTGSASAGGDGRPERVVLPEELFSPEGYRQVVASHDGMARHYLVEAQTSREHAKARFGVQLPLFEEEDGENNMP